MTHPSSGEKLYDQNLTQWLQLSGEYIGRVRPADEARRLDGVPARRDPPLCPAG